MRRAVELQAGQLILEQRLEVLRVELLDLLGRDDAGHDGLILEHALRSRAGDDHFGEAVLGLVECHLEGGLLFGRHLDDLLLITGAGEA